MRDHWRPMDPDEVELIEPDATAFGRSGWGPTPGDEGDGERRDRSDRRLRRWLIAGGASAVVAVVAVALLWWRPWAADDTLTFERRSAGEVTLSERLIIADAPGTMRYRDAGDEAFFADDGSVGYFFAEPGARLPWGEDGSVDSGRWVAAFAIVDDGDSDPETTDDARAVTVQGVPGTIGRAGPITIVSFGPLEGMIYSVGAAGLTDGEVLGFAEAVRIDGEATVVNDRSVIDGMEPLGSFDDYRRVLTLLYVVSDVPWAPGPAVCYDETQRWCLVSEVVGDDALQMMEFVFGLTGDGEVHGEPALVGTSTTDQFDDDLTVLAWREGGRLVVVAGTGTPTDGVALADSVREATDDEWLDVVGSVVDDGFSG